MGRIHIFAKLIILENFDKFLPLCHVCIIQKEKERERRACLEPIRKKTPVKGLGTGAIKGINGN